MDEEIFPANFICDIAMQISGFTDEEIKFAKENAKTISKEDFSSDCVYKEQFGFYFNKKERILVFESLDENTYIELTFLREIISEQISLMIYLIRSFYKFGNINLKKGINNKLIKEKINELVLQKGIFAYCLGDSGFTNNNFDALFKCLEMWSIKTYEGHKVPYSIVINLKEKVTKKDNLEQFCGSFIDFLGEEYSAILSDGITSLIELDKDCNFISYNSITETGVIEACSINDTHLPVRFSQIISKFVTNDSVGCFLLTNGDFVIAKGQEMLFIKRNGKWLNLQKRLFIDSIKDNLSEIKCSDSLLVEIFSTVLDISFSHSGGIIAVVNENGKEWKKDVIQAIKKPVITKIDLLNDDCFIHTYKHIKKLYDKETEKIKNEKINESLEKSKILDLKKRLNKKKILIDLLRDNRKFYELDRKLRSELSGLDGAIILDKDGNILSCGAIIANTAGSSGGGRGSAARTLSKYGGFAIKISTDGYVEVFFNAARIYAIK